MNAPNEINAACAGLPGFYIAALAAVATLGLKFSKVRWKYTKQKIGGGGSGNTAGGWDLTTNRIA